MTFVLSADSSGARLSEDTLHSAIQHLLSRCYFWFADVESSSRVGRMGKSKAVALDDIVLDERCQTRSVMNQEAVDEYAELYQEGEVELPPLQVVEIETDLVLIDGFHRLAGARKAGLNFVRVEMASVNADIGTALWLAAAVNQGHGVRRTNADKRQAVLLALKSDVGEEQSGRTIANHVGVSHVFVNTLRQELEEGVVTVTSPEEPEAEQKAAPERVKREPDRSDMYHTAAKRIAGCYKKVCGILGESDDVCEALFVALEKAKEREL